MDENRVRKVVVVGGGTAGWLVSCLLASHFASNDEGGVDVTLVESSDIPALGVGEGTWPSMRETLKKIGIPESDFIKKCDASFKQGSKFIGWSRGSDEHYYHPFQLPVNNTYDEYIALEDRFKKGRGYAELLCPQVLLEKGHQAPKLVTSNDYSFVVNYGYHLDANKFTLLLREHGTMCLGITRIVDTVKGVSSCENGYISSIFTEGSGNINGDLFIDCSGFTSILMKKHFKIPFVTKKHILFNDSALAVQIPYKDEHEHINSYTLSTAQKHGWIWDIGLSVRRGVGYTYSSLHESDEQAVSTLKTYIKKTTSNQDVESLAFKKIKFEPGYLKKFWHKNCVALGVSSGFIEPLEASALVMIETAANMLVDNFPTTFDAMTMLEEKYNRRFSLHWEHIIEFLKLHYILSEREDSEYWRNNRCRETIPEKLVEKMEYWRHFPPSRYDSAELQELFPLGSYQYILHGMNYKAGSRAPKVRFDESLAMKNISEGIRIARQMVKSLPTNRELLTALNNKN